MTGRRLLAAVALALLAACDGGGGSQAVGDEATSPGSTPAGSPGTSAGPGSGTGQQVDDGRVPPFPADTGPDTARASDGARGSVTDVRLGHHEGYDRVVFEFHGTGTPGWTVRYVPAAMAQGSGERIDLPGEAVLSVAITGAGYPTETGIREFRRGAVTGSGTDVVTQAFFDGTFEGVSQAFVGTTAAQPFRAYLLTDPARLVLDIRAP